MRKILLLFLFTSLHCRGWGQKTCCDDVDSICIDVAKHTDSLTINIITKDPKAQLSFLMQGMTITLCDTSLLPMINIHFPDASIVKDKIRHHPNEVKAMLKSKEQEVRPDLSPVIAALNNVECTATDTIGRTFDCTHIISLDKELGVLSYNINVKLDIELDYLFIDIKSEPITHESEFMGTRISQENMMPANGMGQVPQDNEIHRRKIHITKFAVPIN